MTTTTAVITRQQYMNKEASHQEYYGQFVSGELKRQVQARFGSRLCTSTDPHFNDIPLKEWDNFWSRVPAPIASKMREAGDFPTLAGSVCILKEAARQVVESL